jgi:hypothetical protein
MSPTSLVPGAVAVKPRPIRSGLATGCAPGQRGALAGSRLAGPQPRLAHQVGD